MLKFCLATLLTVFLPTLTLAQGGPPDCAGSQQDMNQCAGATAKAADQALNYRYRQAMENAPDDIAQAKLRAAQRAWIPYRDAACEAAADEARGGSLAPLLEQSCREQMTSRRALELSQTMERPDPGLWSGNALAQLRENAPPEVLRGVFWLPEGIVSADFNRDGLYDLAAVGLRPAAVGGTGGQVHVLLLPAGATVPLHAVLPIGPDSLCAAPIEVRVQSLPGAKPLLVIDDGACDAFRFGVEGSPAVLSVSRN